MQDSSQKETEDGKDDEAFVNMLRELLTDGGTSVLPENYSFHLLGILNNLWKNEQFEVKDGKIHLKMSASEARMCTKCGKYTLVAPAQKFTVCISPTYCGNCGDPHSKIDIDQEMGEILASKREEIISANHPHPPPRPEYVEWRGRKRSESHPPPIQIKTRPSVRIETFPQDLPFQQPKSVNTPRNRAVPILSLKEIEKTFAGGVKFEKKGRRYVRKDEFLKISRRGPVGYVFHLFTDCMTYSEETNHGYKLHRFIDLNETDVEDGGKLTINVKSSAKSFVMHAKTTKTKTEWLRELRSCIETLDKAGARNTAAKAPIWTENDQALGCTYCSKSFSVIRRRHHCRQCGSVVCAQCSSNSKILTNINSKTPQRVCDNCYDTHVFEPISPQQPMVVPANLKQNMVAGTPTTPEITRNDTLNRVLTSEPEVDSDVSSEDEHHTDSPASPSIVPPPPAPPVKGKTKKKPPDLPSATKDDTSPPTRRRILKTRTRIAPSPKNTPSQAEPPKTPSTPKTPRTFDTPKTPRTQPKPEENEEKSVSSTADSPRFANRPKRPVRQKAPPPIPRQKVQPPGRSMWSPPSGVRSPAYTKSSGVRPPTRPGVAKSPPRNTPPRNTPPPTKLQTKTAPRPPEPPTKLHTKTAPPPPEPPVTRRHAPPVPSVPSGETPHTKPAPQPPETPTTRKPAPQAPETPTTRKPAPPASEKPQTKPSPPSAPKPVLKSQDSFRTRPPQPQKPKPSVPRSPAPPKRAKGDKKLLEERDNILNRVYANLGQSYQLDGKPSTPVSEDVPPTNPAPPPPSSPKPAPPSNPRPPPPSTPSTPKPPPSTPSTPKPPPPSTPSTPKPPPPSTPKRKPHSAGRTRKRIVPPPNPSKQKFKTPRRPYE